jgi:hypothetical protein
MSAPTATSLLESTADLAAQHLEELSIGRATTTLSRSEFIELVGYRQALRDIGSAVGVPLPVAPAFLGD